MKKYDVEYKGGDARSLDCISVDYMLVDLGEDEWGDPIELYAEVNCEEYEGETDSYDDLKQMILKQAAERDINPDILHFWYDD